MGARLIRTAKDIFVLSPRERVIFGAVTAFNRLTGRWRYPVPTSGNLETMRRADIIYWLYKCQHPVARAVRGSGLEAFFEAQRELPWELPAGFRVEDELEIASVGNLMDHPFLPSSRDVLYEDVADLVFGADVSTANLECVVAAPGDRAFRMSTSSGAPLCYGPEQFDVAKGPRGRAYSFMSAASNHSLDCGEAGVAATMRALRDAGIAFHGLNDSERDADAATLVEKRGFRLGFVAHTFGLNAKTPPADKPWLVNRAHLNGKLGEVDFARFERQIQFCRDQGVDLAIAHLHWGLEHEYYPRPEQLEVAHHLAEMGFDAVIGHHPHVLQPMERYATKRDPARLVPIFYSLGNPVNPCSHPEIRVSGVARLKLARGTDRDGRRRTYVRDARIVEVFQEIDEAREQIRLVRRQEEGRRRSAKI